MLLLVAEGLVVNIVVVMLKIVLFAVVIWKNLILGCWIIVFACLFLSDS